MPVNILYCEGASGSWDFSLLQMLLVNTCNVYPAGGKDNFSSGIQMARKANSGLSICGLRDRDFDNEKPVPDGQLLEWKITVEQAELHLGWKWERREIENYLIDPEVVSRALGHSYSHFAPPPPDEYERELNRVADEISIYTAARTALSISRLRKSSRLMNSFYPHSTEEECLENIRKILNEYHANLPQENEAIDWFRKLLPECNSGGSRHKNFLTFFSGKDLLVGMNNYLSHSGFKNWEHFTKAILEGMKKAPYLVWSWLPEWENLREKVLN